ncbi:MAG: hypothetical protein Q4A98_05810 [Comamonadaceae bacterium]|nr:hypothetical protein [Comamonadaceae bacterium]
MVQGLGPGPGQGVQGSTPYGAAIMQNYNSKDKKSIFFGMMVNKPIFL